ncbi:MAG: hypothetical protein ABIF10_03825 [Candidatus Woesearchaeota archaeon]
MKRELCLLSVTEMNRLGSGLTHFLRDQGMSVHYGEMTDRWTNGELDPQFHKLRGRSAYILACQGPKDSGDSLLGPILMTGQIAIENGASAAYLVAPMELFGRAERGPLEDSKLQGRGNQVRMLARHLKAAGFKGYMVIDSHQPSATWKIFSEEFGDDNQSFFNVDPTHFLYHYIKSHSIIDMSNQGRKIVFRLPDEGSERRMMPFYNLMAKDYPNASWMQFKKYRTIPNDENSLVLQLSGHSLNFEGTTGKTVIDLDDIVDRAGTLYWLNDKCRQQQDIVNQVGIASQSVGVVTHATLAMDARDWSRHLEALSRLSKINYSEFITTNTLPYIEYLINVRRVPDQTLAIEGELRQFTSEQRQMYHNLQQTTTILEVKQSIGQAIVYLENFQGNLPNNFDVNNAFLDPLPGDPNNKVAHYEYHRSKHFRSVKIRMTENNSPQ